MRAIKIIIKCLSQIDYLIYFKIKQFCDYYRGVDFLSSLPPEDLGLDPKKINRGSPSGNRYVKNVFENLSISKDDKILDIGCAKGDALRVMKKFPFGLVSGLEISKQYSDICKKNFKKLKEEVFIHNCDAKYFDGYCNYNYFYLYNPFHDVELVKSIAINIKNQCSGKVTIIYNNPRGVEYFLSSGFKVKEKHKGQWGKEILLLVSNF